MDIPCQVLKTSFKCKGKFKIWTVFDLKDRCHQIPIHENSKHYTCMSTPIGTHQWKVLPMGLKNATSVFQKVMDWVFKDMKNVDPCIDDIIIGSTGDTWDGMNCCTIMRRM